MQNFDWPATFRKVYDRAAQNYHAGRSQPATIVNSADAAFLAGIGCSCQELFDFVDDAVRHGEPSFETVLLITAVRREYFLTVQRGRPSSRQVDMAVLPAKSAQLGGIAWWPRIIEKAGAKLRGEMPPDLMYGCGGDRAFLRDINLSPDDFLRLVWAVDGDPQKVLQHVKPRGG